MLSDQIDDDLLTDILRDMILEDEALSIFGLMDNGEYADDYSGSGSMMRALGDTANPVPGTFRWGQEITDFSLDATFLGLGTDTIIATVHRELEGNTKVIWTQEQDGNTQADSLVKPFTMNTIRNVRFVKIASSGTARKDWKLEGVSALLGTIGSKVSINQISFSFSDSSDTYFSLFRAKLSTTFFDRANLPRFRPSEAVQMHVRISNSAPILPIGSGERVLIRDYQSGKMGRVRLNDLGLGIDETGLDDTFSGTWYPHDAAEGQLASLFIEVLDHASLLVADEEYHSEFVGLPYIVDSGGQPAPF